MKETVYEQGGHKNISEKGKPWYRRGYKHKKIHDLCKLEAMKIQAEGFRILEGDQNTF